MTQENLSCEGQESPLSPTEGPMNEKRPARDILSFHDTGLLFGNPEVRNNDAVTPSECQGKWFSAEDFIPKQT